jgi:hypothetical protein
MLAEAMRCLRTLGSRAPDDLAVFEAFLQNPHDDLVVETLGLLGRYRSYHALPAMLELYRMYPTPDSVRTDIDGERRLALFGHPLKQRARPAVVAALKRSLAEITGQAFETPAALEEYLAAADVRANNP